MPSVRRQTVHDDVLSFQDVTIIKRLRDEAGPFPFGKEDMTAIRARDELAPLLRDVRSAVSEAVRVIYFTDPVRKNVRIKDNYSTAEYWDGRDWWVVGIREAVNMVVAVAIEELEYCVDWSESVPDQYKHDFENYLAMWRGDPSLREEVAKLVVEVMIRPIKDATE